MFLRNAAYCCVVLRKITILLSERWRFTVTFTMVSEGECGHLIFSDKSEKDPDFTLKILLFHGIDSVFLNGLGHFIVKIEIFG